MLSRELTRSLISKLIRSQSLRKTTLPQNILCLTRQNQNITSLNRFFTSMREAETNAQKEETKLKSEGEKKPELKQEEPEDVSQQQAISELQEELAVKQEEIESLKETLEKKNNKEKELLKEIQYLAAERNNLVTRYKKQLGDAQVYAISKFAKDIVEVRDNLQRAMDIEVPEGEEKEIQKLEQHYQNLKQGVELTAKSLDAILKRNKIEVINPEGEDFDPKMHDAMFEFPDKEKKTGKVGKVLRTGWKIGERVLRSATVGVVKNVD